MVELRGERFFACEMCGLVYEEAGLASECEAWCRSTGTCRLDLVRRAVGRVVRA